MLLMSARTLGLAAVVLLGIMAYHLWKPLPAGVRLTGREHRVPAQSVTFLADRTYIDADGVRHSEQEIFDEVLRMIAGAEQYILLDMFLYNDFQGRPPEQTRALAGELTGALLRQKQRHPAMTITVISDPLNTVYGGAASVHFEQLRRQGIAVVLTDLTKLRDSNPLYSVWWRTLVQWFGNADERGVLPHPFQADGAAVTARSWLALLNFKANHRKLIVADAPRRDGTTKLVTLAASANPHDGSSAHSNVAIAVADKLWQEAIASERAVGDFSAAPVPEFGGAVTDGDGSVTVQLLTEGAIRERLVALFDAAKAGDSIDLAMFYLSDRAIMKALVGAAERGASLRLILDPNKDAFGRTKNGVPNRPAAHELVQKSGGKISIRWCDTHGEQCHGKLVLLRIGGRRIMTAGSANLTRRNIGDYNLETNVLVSADEDIPALAAAHSYFEEIWNNEGGRIFTTDYAAYAEASVFKTVLYRLQEATGLSSF